MEAENQSLGQTIKAKEETIKELTKENLTVKTCLTQMQQLLCAQEDREQRIVALEKSLAEQSDFKDNLQAQYENCSTRLIEAEEKY